MFFSGRRNRGPLVRGNSPGEQFLRFMLLIAVFVGTGWLFWLNAEKSMEKIEARGTVVDLGESLSQEERETLRDMGTLFKSEYGLLLKVVVSAKHLQLPEANGKTMFFGINPATRRVEIQLPPLVQNALGPNIVRELVQRHFRPHFSNDTWPQGLLEALKDIWQRLGALQSYQGEEQRFTFEPEPVPPATTSAPENSQ